MRIRTILFIGFLCAILLPTAMFGWWSYKVGVDREFREVSDRHLLIAQNLGRALERYRIDVVAATETIAGTMLREQNLPTLEQLMRRLDINYVLLVNAQDGTVVRSAVRPLVYHEDVLPSNRLKLFNEMARLTETTFSPVITELNGKTAMFAFRRHGDFISVSQIGTSYFADLGASIAFGENGYAAIVDQAGNILAHPMREWVRQGRNVADIKAVSHMMAGESGTVAFYSEAFETEMIAGVSTVPGTGWGIMVPQPVSEIYAKVHENNLAIEVALVVQFSIIAMFMLLLRNSLASPLERFASFMKSNALRSKLTASSQKPGLMAIRELSDFQSSYNVMVDRVSAANQQIEKLAYTDNVTGLPNREKFEAVVKDIFSDPPQLQAGGALVFIDLDNFKDVNDLYGHEAGDLFLMECGRKLSSVTDNLQTEVLNAVAGPDRVPPIVSRIGGDEFTILLPGLTDEGMVEDFLSRLLVEIQNPAEEFPYSTECSASIGCARYPLDGTSLDGLLKRADIAMYHAKKTGRNRAQIFNSNIGEQTEAELRRDIIHAIETGQMELEYQPKVSVRGLAIDGAEALVRWRHPEMGMVAPGVWIPAIANSPVIAKLGEWVVNQAMTDHAKWRKAGFDISVAVNIGSRHFIMPDFIEMLNKTAERHQFERSHLELEVTEDVLFGMDDRATDVVNALHKLGYTISIDDFGTGYSNIARLARLPVDYLKIDRSIIEGARHDERVRAILVSTMKMAKDLNCQTVAEGIETAGHVLFATQLGADVMQGYYFARSMSADDLITWMKTSPKIRNGAGEACEAAGIS